MCRPQFGPIDDFLLCPFFFFSLSVIKKFIDSKEKYREREK